MFPAVCCLLSAVPDPHRGYGRPIWNIKPWVIQATGISKISVRVDAKTV